MDYKTTESTGKDERSKAENSISKSSIQYVFEKLYHSGNTAESIQSALALVAGHYSFERGYIFETDKDGKTTSNTFEWCAKGVTSEIDNLQKVPIEAASTANASFYKTGIFVLRSLDELSPEESSVLEPQGIKSMVQFGIFNKGLLIGFLGFDNCRSGALRNDEEIDEIATICNILSTFFVKQRTEEAFAKHVKLQMDVINHLNNFVYVIEPLTYKVLYMNEQARNIMKNIECKTPCYTYLKDNIKPCEKCVINRLKSENLIKATQEGYNEKLGLWLETTASVIEWKDGKPVYLIESANITEQKREHTEHIKQLERLAFVDELTGSRSFYKFKEDALKILELEDNKKHFLVKLDIENFKLINQIYGYEKGDSILRCIAKSLEKTMRSENEIFARVFNDDFVALFTMLKEKDLTELFEVFLNNFHRLIGDDISFKFTFAYGIYIINSDDKGKSHINDLFEKVNVAHKVAKQDKAKNATIYNENMIKKALQTREVESKMTKALAKNEFEVYLQPKYILDSGKIGGAEALVRWNNENKNLFSPDAFISIFEGNGFITKIDFYVLKSVCNIIKNWIDNGIEPVVISVNFSRIHLSDKDFVKHLCEVVEEIGIEKKYIEIELTETIIFENVEVLETLILELHQNGFTLSMDDFGSGYSSLGMLKNIKVDNIKMDRSFFAKQKDPIRSKIVLDFIIKMAHTLGISIIAEGVEEKTQIELLKELQCDMVQGFYFAKPMPLKQFQKLIIHQQKKK